MGMLFLILCGTSFLNSCTKNRVGAKAVPCVLTYQTLHSSAAREWISHRLMVAGKETEAGNIASVSVPRVLPLSLQHELSGVQAVSWVLA